MHRTHRIARAASVLAEIERFTARVGEAGPRRVPVYGFNLGGYRATVLDAGQANRHEFGA